MPQFQPGDIVEYTTHWGEIRVREVSYVRGGRTWFASGSSLRTYRLRYHESNFERKLTGFAKWHKERVDARV